MSCNFKIVRFVRTGGSSETYYRFKNILIRWMANLCKEKLIEKYYKYVHTEQLVMPFHTKKKPLRIQKYADTCRRDYVNSLRTVLILKKNNNNF